MIIEYTLPNSKRLDIFLSESLDITRSQVKILIDNNAVLVDDKVCKSGYQLKAGNIIFVDTEYLHPLDEKILPQNLPLDIVYEDEHLIVINKEQGMVVHPASGVYTDTLVNALLYHFSQLSDVNGAARPGILHRIDKNTSGLLVVAKTNFAHNSLAAQIESRRAHRCYLALCEGVIKDDERDIETCIGRDERNRTKMCVKEIGDGKYAISHMDVVERFERHTLTRWVLGTGRTHQIRVHAQFIKHPIVGDPEYGFKTQEFRLNGQLLHAYELSFEHPITGQFLMFHASVPSIFSKTVSKLRTIERLPKYDELCIEKYMNNGV